MSKWVGTIGDSTPCPRRVVACCYRRHGSIAEMLLVRTRRGAWTFPGGKVEPGETLPQAAAREAREEAGVTGPVGADPIAWVRIRKRPQDLFHDGTMSPVFLVRVEALEKPAEAYRHPAWWPLSQVEQALRRGRAPWSGRWGTPAARAAVAAIARPADPLGS